MTTYQQILTFAPTLITVLSWQQIPFYPKSTIIIRARKFLISQIFVEHLALQPAQVLNWLQLALQMQCTCFYGDLYNGRKKWCFWAWWWKLNRIMFARPPDMHRVTSEKNCSRSSHPSCGHGRGIGHVGYSKNPYMWRNRIIPNEATVGDRSWNHEATGWVVPGPFLVAKLGIMWFLNGYGFLLLSHDSWE